MGGKKIEKKILPETHVYSEQKTMEKNRMEKAQKHVFYKHTNNVTKKWGKKTREIFFSKNTLISGYKNDGIKSSWKKCENTFFYENTNIVTKKWRGKTREKFFPETHVYREF